MRSHLNLDRSRVGREARLAAASSRQEAREGRSSTEQVQVLNARLGAGQGARKERARLKESK